MTKIILAIIVVLIIGTAGAWYLYFSPANFKSPAVQQTVKIEDIAPTGAATVIPTQPTDPVAAVKQLAALQFNVTEDKLTIVSSNKKDWPDTCFGLSIDNKSCVKTVTPGYEVVVKLNSDQITYRTNSNGSDIRIVK